MELRATLGKNPRISFFSPHLPVLIEPVVDLGLGVDGVPEVGGSGGSDPEFGLFSAVDVVD
jgi:hypothetical protein